MPTNGVCICVRVQMPALSWPLSIGLMADPGQTFNTVHTINHMQVGGGGREQGQDAKRVLKYQSTKPSNLRQTISGAGHMLSCTRNITVPCCTHMHSPLSVPSSILQDMSPDVLVLVGDFAYADNYGANGSEGVPGTCEGQQGEGWGFGGCPRHIRGAAGEWREAWEGEEAKGGAVDELGSACMLNKSSGGWEREIEEGQGRTASQCWCRKNTSSHDVIPCIWFCIAAALPAQHLRHLRSVVHPLPSLSALVHPWQMTHVSLPCSQTSRGGTPGGACSSRCCHASPSSTPTATTKWSGCPAMSSSPRTTIASLHQGKEGVRRGKGGWVPAAGVADSSFGTCVIVGYTRAQA
jgi:hypothetical protein